MRRRGNRTEISPGARKPAFPSFWNLTAARGEGPGTPTMVDLPLSDLMLSVDLPGRWFQAREDTR